jgi:hypothetical protein
MRAMTVAVPSLIHVSLAVFFFGVRDYQLSFNTIIGVIIIVPICCGSFFLYGMLAPHINMSSPHPVLVADILDADALAIQFR